MEPKIIYLSNGNDGYYAFGMHLLRGSREDVQPRIVHARGGDDYAMGGRGDDLIYGGVGDDTLHGGAASMTDGLYFLIIRFLEGTIACTATPETIRWTAGTEPMCCMAAAAPICCAAATATICSTRKWRR